MDWSDLLRNNAVGATLGAIIASSGGPPAPTPTAADAAQEPTPAAAVRGERAKEQWEKIADLPIEPGLYVDHDPGRRQLCHLVVFPANKAESRMDYALHCGVDTRPKAEVRK